MSNVEAQVATLQDVYITAPTEAQGFLAAAVGMREGIRPLGSLASPPAFALTLLCGHACEAALKALLAERGFAAAT